MLSEIVDSIVWPRTSSGRFSVMSLYNKLVLGFVPNRFRGIWKACIPLKIKIFMWQAFREKLLAVDQIRKHNRSGSDFFAAVEDTDHILFRCLLALMLWSCLP